MDPNWIEKINKLFLDDDDDDSDGDSNNKSKPEMDVENMISFFSGSMPEELLVGRFKSKENAAPKMSNGGKQQPIKNGSATSQAVAASTGAVRRSTLPKNSKVEDKIPSPLRLAEASQYSCTISSDENDEYIPQDYYPVPKTNAAATTVSAEPMQKKKKKKPRQRLRTRNKAFLSSVDVALDVLAMAVANRLHQMGTDVNNDEEIAKAINEVVSEMNFPEQIAEAIANDATKIYKSTANRTQQQYQESMDKLNKLIAQINQNHSEDESADLGNINLRHPNAPKMIAIEINANLFACEESLASFRANAGESQSGAVKKDAPKADQETDPPGEHRRPRISERERLIMEEQLGKKIEKTISDCASANSREGPKTQGFDMEQFLEDRAARQKAEEEAEYEFGVNDILANLKKQDINDKQAASGPPAGVKMVDKSVGTDDDDLGVGKEEPRLAAPAGRRSWFAGPMFMPSASTLKQELENKAKEAEKNKTQLADHEEEEGLFEWYENGEVQSGNLYPFVLGKRTSKK